MSRKYKFHNPDGVYIVTFVAQGWVDVFIRKGYKNILVDNLAVEDIKKPGAFTSRA